MPRFLLQNMLGNTPEDLEDMLLEAPNIERAVEAFHSPNRVFIFDHSPTFAEWRDATRQSGKECWYAIFPAPTFDTHLDDVKIIYETYRTK